MIDTHRPLVPEFIHMPTPIPQPNDTNLGPPDFDEVQIIARGLASATSGDKGLTELQESVLCAIAKSMHGFEVDVASQLERLATDYIDHYGQPPSTPVPRPTTARRRQRSTPPDQPLRITRSTRCHGLINEYRNAA